MAAVPHGSLRMILLPAIDLKGGACVRLVRGEMASATQFHHDPSAQARDFAAVGFNWLHVVDLDGAFSGASVNGEAVRAIRRAVPQMIIELGGGIRDRGAIDAWLDLGIDRVVLGTVALRDPNLVRMAARDNPDRVVVGIDGRDGKVAVEGWAETSEIGVVELGLRFADAGVAAIVVTDITRDGTLEGIDADAIGAFAKTVGIPVIASGGVSTLADIVALKAHEKDGVAGAIVGRALYDGGLDARAALALAKGQP
jgi:phosphoribosylformimino-5-aminoimidazole carboxamide ribotide isomerase